jgi:hypothetical protein
MSEYTQPPLPGTVPPVTELDERGAELAERLRKCRKAIKDWKAAEDECRNELIKLVTGGTTEEGTYTGLWHGNVVVAANVYTTRKFDSKMFQSDHPQLFESYKRESTVTVLNVASAGE